MPAAERAYLATKELILTGKLTGGSLVSEGDIADSLSLSRTPVREAFLRLQSEQLLRLIPKRGAVVLPVPATEAADVLDVRLSLESGAVARLVQLDDELDELLAPFADRLTTQRALANARDIAGFAEADEQFHRAIVSAAGNAIADGFYAGLADRQRRMSIGANQPRPARLTVLVTEHRRLLEEIYARDLSGFTVALRAHLDATHRALHDR